MYEGFVVSLMNGYEIFVDAMLESKSFLFSNFCVELIDGERQGLSATGIPLLSFFLTRRS